MQHMRSTNLSDWLDNEKVGPVESNMKKKIKSQNRFLKFFVEPSDYVRS